MSNQNDENKSKALSHFKSGSIKKLGITAAGFPAAISAIGGTLLAQKHTVGIDAYNPLYTALPAGMAGVGILAHIANKKSKPEFDKADKFARMAQIREYTIVDKINDLLKLDESFVDLTINPKYHALPQKDKNKLLADDEFHDKISNMRHNKNKIVNIGSVIGASLGGLGYHTGNHTLLGAGIGTIGPTLAHAFGTEYKIGKMVNSKIDEIKK